MSAEKESVSAREIFDAYAENYAERFMDVSAYRSGIDFFLQHLSEGASLLEVACGPGNVTLVLNTERPDLQILASDVAPNMLKLARLHLPNVEFCELDSRNIKSLNRTFEGVLAGFCLPYLRVEETIQFISDAADLLQPSGCLYISTMEGESKRCGIKMPSNGEGKGTYMSYYTEDFLRTALLDHGFEVLLCERVQQEPESDIDLIVVAQLSAS